MAASREAPGVDELVRDGVLNYNAGNYKTSYDLFKQAMKINPNHPEASRWFWKMKSEHDVTTLSDSGPALTEAESPKEGKAVEKIPEVTEKDREEAARVPVVRTAEKAVVTTRPDPGIRVIDRKIQNIDQKLSRLYTELKAYKEKEARVEKAPEPPGIDWNSPYLIMLAFISLIFILIFLTALIFYRSRIRRIPPTPQPAAGNVPGSTFDRPDWEGGQDKKFLALSMARKVLGESPDQADKLVKMIARLSLDDDEAVRKESRKLLKSKGGLRAGRKR
jgi:tetratricopeptide (TPR) repeat protein